MKSEELASGGDCNCIALVNEQLQREMTGCYLRVFTNLTTGKTKPAIATERRTGKGRKPPMFVPTFCPFCGIKYPEPKTTPINEPEGER